MSDQERAEALDKIGRLLSKAESDARLLEGRDFKLRPWAEAYRLLEMLRPRPEGAIGRAERFVASGGDTEVLLEGLPNGSPSGWDPALVKAINEALLDRGAKVVLPDLSQDLWDRFVGPMLDAIQHGEYHPD